MIRQTVGVAIPIISLLCGAAVANSAADESNLTEETDSFISELEQGFYYRINLMNFGIAQGPKHSDINPNNIFSIPSYQVVFNPRLDLNLDYERIELSVKERFWDIWQHVSDGKNSGFESNTAQFYLNEWFARLRILDDLFISYGRENLQWGPSALLSSSNPFNAQNGRNNPRIEVPGLGYARAVWVPSSNLAVSFIANTDSGRLYNAQYFGLNQTSFLTPTETVSSRRFTNAYAIKVDYTGDGKYFSIIPNYRDSTGYQAGYFGGWNISDAILLYSEGILGERIDFQIQGGASYTFEDGQSINLEYYHNNNGCLAPSIRQCFVTGQITANDVYWRQDYLMAQYSETKIYDNINVNLRYVQDLNDQSNQMIGIIEYEANDNTLLYLITSGYTGTSKSEFGSLLKYSVMVGLGYTF